MTAPGDGAKSLDPHSANSAGAWKGAEQNGRGLMAAVYRCGFSCGVGVATWLHEGGMERLKVFLRPVHNCRCQDWGRGRYRVKGSSTDQDSHVERQPFCRERRVGSCVPTVETWDRLDNREERSWTTVAESMWPRSRALLFRLWIGACRRRRLSRAAQRRGGGTEEPSSKRRRYWSAMTAVVCSLHQPCEA